MRRLGVGGSGAGWWRLTGPHGASDGGVKEGVSGARGPRAQAVVTSGGGVGAGRRDASSAVEESVVGVERP
uniref:DUF834 domain-containing protein n=1 Tax=Oryza glaberrima TaxID=4538 RepID=I1PAY0_ORYGL